MGCRIALPMLLLKRGKECPNPCAGVSIDSDRARVHARAQPAAAAAWAEKDLQKLADYEEELRLEEEVFKNSKSS